MTDVVCTLTGFNYQDSTSHHLYLFMTPSLAITGPWTTTATFAATQMVSATETLSGDIIGELSLPAGGAAIISPGGYFPGDAVTVNFGVVVSSASMGNEKVYIPAAVVETNGISPASSVTIGAGSNCPNFGSTQAGATDCGAATGGYYVCSAGTWSVGATNDVCVHFIPTRSDLCLSSSIWSTTADYFTNMTFPVLSNQTAQFTDVAVASMTSDQPKAGESVDIEYRLNVTATSVGGEQITFDSSAVQSMEFALNGGGFQTCTIGSTLVVCSLPVGAFTYTHSSYPWTEVVIRVTPNPTIVGGWGQKPVFSANCFESVSITTDLSVMALSTIQAQPTPSVLEVGGTTVISVTIGVSATPTASTFVHFRGANSSSLTQPVAAVLTCAWSTDANAAPDARTSCTVLTGSYPDVVCNISSHAGILSSGSPASYYFWFVPNNGADLGTWSFDAYFTSNGFLPATVETNLTMTGNMSLTILPGEPLTLTSGQQANTTLAITSTHVTSLRGSACPYAYACVHICPPPHL